MHTEQFLKAALLLDGKIRGRREEIKSNLIKLTLSEFDEGDEITSKDIRLKLKSSHNLQIREEAIEEILHDLQPGYVKSTGNDKYIVAEPMEFKTLDQRIGSLWNEFQPILSSQIGEIDPYVQRRFKSGFSDFFEEFISILASSVEELEEHQKDVLISDWGKAEEICNEAAEKNNIKQRAIFRDSIKQYLNDPGDGLLELVDSCYTTAVNIDLISKADSIEFPELPERNSTLILDTNVLVSLLAETDPQHELARIVCERTPELEFDLRFTKGTEDELEALIKRCESEMSGLHTGSGNIELANNQFVEDFGRQRNREWQDYIRYLKNWKEVVEEKYDIIRLENQKSPNQEIVEACTEKFLERNSYEVNRHKLGKIDTDAQNLGLIGSYRKHSNWDFGPFVLSFHNSLTEIGIELAKSGEFESIIGDRPTAIQPRSWLKYIMAFTPTETTTDKHNEIAKSIIQISSNFEDDISVDEYMHTLAPKLGVKNNNEQYLKKIIVNHPTLSEDFEKAVSDDDGNQAEKLAREILTDKEYLQAIEDEKEYEETMKDASSRIQELQEEVRELESGTSSGHSDFRSEYARAVEQFQAAINTSIEDSEYSSPPSEDADLSEIKEWVEITIGQINMADIKPKRIVEVKSELEDVLVGIIEQQNN